MVNAGGFGPLQNGNEAPSCRAGFAVQWTAGGLIGSHGCIINQPPRARYLRAITPSICYIQPGKAVSDSTTPPIPIRLGLCLVLCSRCIIRVGYHPIVVLLGGVQNSVNRVAEASPARQARTTRFVCALSLWSCDRIVERRLQLLEL